MVITANTISKIQSAGPEWPVSSTPYLASSRPRSGFIRIVLVNASGTDTTAETNPRAEETERCAQGLPLRLRPHHNPVPRQPTLHPVIRLILSVRVPTSQPPERPGQILREEFIKTGRLTQAALAQRMGVPIAKVRGILSGEEGITAETALQLEAALGVEAEFWIRAQFVWDCYRLREVERRTAVLEHEGKAKRPKS